MGQFGIKLQDGDRAYWLQWSTVVDAPIYVALSLEDYRSYVRGRFGDAGVESMERDGAFERLESIGCAARSYDSVADAVAGNRAGPDEATSSIEDILEDYCRGRSESGPC